MNGMERWPDTKLAASMLTDANILSRAAEPGTPAADAALHIQALLERVRTLEAKVAAQADEIEVLQAQVPAASERSESWRAIAEGQATAVDRERVGFAGNTVTLAAARLDWLLSCELAVDAVAQQRESPHLSPGEVVADLLGARR